MDLLKYEPKNCKEAFSLLSQRQVTALMFHSEMSEMFHFLGLSGFEALHRYQYLTESIAHLDMKHYYLDSKGVLLPDGGVDSIDVIPSEWLRYTQEDVTPQVRDQAIQKALEQYEDWEKETKLVYEKYIAYLLAWQQVSDALYLSHLLEEVNTELRELNSLALYLGGISYDPIGVMALQDDLRATYGKKLKHLKG